MLNRRMFLVGSVVAVASARAVEAQPGGIRRIGYIATGQPTPVTASFWEAFVAGLRTHGWFEGGNIVIDRRYVEQGPDAPVAALTELIRIPVETIVLSTTQAALAAKKLTRTVPIVLTVPSDPVAVGLVDSLARPGGNITGLSFVGTELAGKQVELLKEAVPRLSSIGVLANPLNVSHGPRTREVVAAARALALRIVVVEANSRDKLAETFTTMAKSGVGAALVLSDATFVRAFDALIRLAADHHLPVMYGLKEAPVAGGLISYGPSFTDLFRRAAGYVDRILRGAKPGDLPVEQASRFELVINLKTAKALGLTMPPSLLLRADQIIE